jgi:lipoprotein-releasing system ATP-binding protein
MTATQGEPVLVGRRLVKTFRDGEVLTPVLRGVDLAITEGEFVALMGPSGSGKSTLLSILGTLLRPTTGEVLIAGQETSGLSEKALTVLRNRRIGFVFQFHHLLPEFTALENVLFPAYARDGRERPETLRRAADLLDAVGLSHRADYRVTRISGGEKQRVAVARALMMSPDVVLADEPTGNLDRETGWAVLDLVRDLARREGTAFLVSTHDPEIARRSDRIVRIVDGHLVDDGAPDGAPGGI